MIIYVCGPVGFETAKKLCDEHREELKERFAAFFLEQFESISGETLNAPLQEEELRYSREISGGGIYRALWEAGEALGCGMRVANAAIPVRQEIVEILELYGESPYECSSRGSMLVISENELAEVTCAGKSFPVFMIGITTEGRARVLEDGDLVRYLTPPARQDKDIQDRFQHA